MIKYLNRELTWGPDGVTYEHDRKHVQNLPQELGVLDSVGVNAPGVKEVKPHLDRRRPHR